MTDGRVATLNVPLCRREYNNGWYSDIELKEGEGPALDIALLHDEHMLRIVLQSRKWQLIGMS